MRQFRGRSAVLALLLGLGLAWADPSGAQPSAGNRLCTFHTTATAAGNGTACDVSGYTLIAIQLSGTLTGTVATPEGSVDGTNFTSLYCMSVPSLQIGVTSLGRPGRSGVRSKAIKLCGCGSAGRGRPPVSRPKALR